MNGDAWTRAEKKIEAKIRRDAERRDLRDEWRAYHLRLAASHARIAVEHKARAQALDEPNA